MAVATFNGRSSRRRLTPPLDAPWGMGCNGAAMAAPSPADLQFDITPLAEGFAPPSREAWLALVEKTLKGAPIDSLTRETLEGLPILPLYEAAETQFPARATPGWDLRTPVGHGDAAGANAQALSDLAEGAGSLLLRIDPTGERGVAIGSADGLARVLEGVLLDVAPVALDAGFLGAEGRRLAGRARQGRAGRPVRLPPRPAERLRRGRRQPRADRGAPDRRRHRRRAPRRALSEGEPLPGLRPRGARGRRRRGGRSWRFAAAAALAYAKALTRAGLRDRRRVRPHRARASRSTPTTSSAIAKLRAARRLWARLAGACGVDAPARIEARSSGRMLTRADPWTNMIRLTAAAFAARGGRRRRRRAGRLHRRARRADALRAAPVAQHPAGAGRGGRPRPRRRSGRRRRLPGDAHRRAGPRRLGPLPGHRGGPAARCGRWRAASSPKRSRRPAPS